MGRRTSLEPGENRPLKKPLDKGDFWKPGENSTLRRVARPCQREKTRQPSSWFVVIIRPWGLSGEDSANDPLHSADARARRTAEGAPCQRRP